MSDSGKRRWHDNHNDINHSVENMLLLPGDFQSVVADGINVMAEENHQASDALKSVGRDKITQLLKSKKKQRLYDKNASFHKTMNYLTILPEPKRDQLGKNFNDISTTVVNYVEDCKLTEQRPQINEVQQMTHLFVQSKGSKAVLDMYLDKAHPEFKAIDRTAKSVPVAPPKLQPKGDSVAGRDFHENIGGSDSDMRIELN